MSDWNWPDQSRRANPDDASNDALPPVPVECGAGLHDGLRVVAHCSLEPGHTGWHTDDELAHAWAPTVPVYSNESPPLARVINVPLLPDPTGITEALIGTAELPHMPGCTDPDHRPLTSLCTTEPYRTGIPWASA
jgi:hypothetical protein